jgi:hypothetical protein
MPCRKRSRRQRSPGGERKAGPAHGQGLALTKRAPWSDPARHGCPRFQGRDPSCPGGPAGVMLKFSDRFDVLANSSVERNSNVDTSDTVRDRSAGSHSWAHHPSTRTRPPQGPAALSWKFPHNHARPTCRRPRRWSPLAGCNFGGVPRAQVCRGALHQPGESHWHLIRFSYAC